MKVVELLTISTELLKVMSQNDVFRDDFKYIPLYEKYRKMRDSGEKHIVAINILSEEFGVSTRSVERIIKRLSADC